MFSAISFADVKFGVHDTPRHFEDMVGSKVAEPIFTDTFFSETLVFV